MKKEDWNKTSRKYYSEILSPIKDTKQNPLFSDLKKLKSKKRTAIDLGCGLGELEPLLSKYFKQITAIDFSSEMIKQAKEKNSTLSNISLEVADLSNLSNYKGKFNIAISINSLLDPNLNTIDKQLKEIHSVLKNKGTFLCILPAMEVYIYQAQLLKQKSKDHLIQEYTKPKEHNFPLGIINFEGKQKAFYQFEIPWRFKKAGFKNIQIDKVLYPWKEFKEAGQLSFPKEPLPWDWYVKCVR